MLETAAPAGTLAPGPRPWPFVGNLPAIRSQGVLRFFEANWHLHGDTFAVNMGSPAIVFAHPDAIKRILITNSKNYVKGAAYDGVRRVIGNGILALEGAEWKKRRSVLNPAFHRSALVGLTATMAESGRRYFDGLLAQHGRETFEVDAHREMVALTLDVVVCALFGRDLGGATDVSFEALGAAVELLSEGGNGLVLPKWVPTPHNRKFHRTMEECEGAVYRVIEAGRRAGPGQPTLLGMLLDSRDAETEQPLTDREVRDEVFTMFIAGHETTALTLTWMFTLLVGQSDVMARMREEVDRVLGDRDPTFEDLPRLVYLRQVVDETLRLRGPVAMLARNTVADDEVQGFRVPAGSLVFPFLWGTHRHRDFWTDPDRFDPDRFSAERSVGRHPGSYLPFSSGQRQCIGNVFSLFETVVLLAQLLRRFDVDVDPSAANVEPNLIATLRPTGPVRVRLTPR